MSDFIEVFRIMREMNDVINFLEQFTLANTELIQEKTLKKKNR